MTRPILWALGTLATAALSATLTGERLAGRFGLGGAPAAQASSTAQMSSAIQAASAGGAGLTVAADLAGHFVVHPSLDGRRLRMLVDTGASVVALSHEDALLAGIRVAERDFTRRLSTANGAVDAAPIRIRELRVGDIVVRDVEGMVLPPGRLGTSLLGMSFLRRLRGFEMGGGRLTLRG